MCRCQPRSASTSTNIMATIRTSPFLKGSSVSLHACLPSTALRAGQRPRGVHRPLSSLTLADQTVAGLMVADQLQTGSIQDTARPCHQVLKDMSLPCSYLTGVAALHQALSGDTPVLCAELCLAE